MFSQRSRLRILFVPPEWDFCSLCRCCGRFGVHGFWAFAEFDLFFYCPSRSAPILPACVLWYLKKIARPPFPPGWWNS